MCLLRTARRIGALLVILLVAGLLGATLVRFAPGFDMDERQLDARLNEASLQALRTSNSSGQNIVAFYGQYLAKLLTGDLGVSRAFGRPVRELLAERLPVTARLIGSGLLFGWLLGLTAAILASFARLRIFDFVLGSVSGFCLSVPAALFAFGSLYLGVPVSLCMAVVVFPRVFRYARNALLAARSLPHVLAARTRGVSGLSIALRHVAPTALPQIFSLAGVSVAIALGADVPVEVLSDVPGIGQLAWQAATGRDMPLLVGLTLLVTLAVLVANAVADTTISAWEGVRG